MRKRRIILVSLIAVVAFSSGISRAQKRTQQQLHTETSNQINQQATYKYSLLLQALSSLGAALIGGTVVIFSQHIRLKADRKAERESICETIESKILRACFILQQNIEAAISLSYAIAYEKSEDGKRTEMHIRKLDITASAIVNPISLERLNSPIPKEYREVIKQLVSANQYATLTKTYWSEEYLQALKDKAIANLKTDTFPTTLVKNHIDVMCFIVCDSGLSSFKNLWSLDEILKLIQNTFLIVIDEKTTDKLERMKNSTCKRS